MSQNNRAVDYTDNEMDVLSQRIIINLESASCKDLSDAQCAKSILDEIDDASTGAESEIGKRAVIKALLFSTWNQRLYFIIRSMIMGIISMGLTSLFVLYFGTIEITLSVVMA
ncbi:MAG: hypothetical protein QG670_2369 [Thermoproteota archaeon]|nr:hypothetical protein [Thermoproteota archaeon]